MNILDHIIAHKQQEVNLRRSRKGIKELETSPLFQTEKISLKSHLLNPDKSGIIAEHKRKSPSKGIINDTLQLEDVVKGYQEAGASAISVLTDVDFFGGSDDDLMKARQVTSLPLLRKDFIIDEYQIIEAKALGANVILLIAACLSPSQIKRFATLARSLSMEVLLEVHSENELLCNLIEEVDCIGVNNRNLKDFTVSIDTSLTLSSKIPEQYIKISESGIDKIETILLLKSVGYNGFLIGENFMKTANPGQSLKEFVIQLNVKH
ncbi:MAG: indole-3-glycerol phosphate synthase TrpC [Cytophagaceae bacterium]|nr:indole-3-glycerol phosphate synthase TrpC [Cytophagaceae bacterium]MDW8455466.1 indole-3-glycerol phosphate synthase TrpC [Cytophagaceae bacterium]